MGIPPPRTRASLSVQESPKVSRSVFFSCFNGFCAQATNLKSKPSLVATQFVTQFPSTFTAELHLFLHNRFCCFEDLIQVPLKQVIFLISWGHLQRFLSRTSINILRGQNHERGTDRAKKSVSSNRLQHPPGLQWREHDPFYACVLSVHVARKFSDLCLQTILLPNLYKA